MKIQKKIFYTMLLTIVLLVSAVVVTSTNLAIHPLSNIVKSSSDTLSVDSDSDGIIDEAEIASNVVLGNKGFFSPYSTGGAELRLGSSYIRDSGDNILHISGSLIQMDNNLLASGICFGTDCISSWSEISGEASFPTCGEGQILKYNGAEWVCSTDNAFGDGISPPLKIELISNLTDVGSECVHDVNLRDYCGDEDGCVIKIMMHNKNRGDDLVNSNEVHIYMEQEDLSRNLSGGVYFHTMFTYGGSIDSFTGTSSLVTIFDYGGWANMLNHKPYYCSDQTATSDAYTDPYTFTFTSAWYTKTVFFIYDSI